MLTLTDKIKARAIELGFDKVGIARAVVLEEEGKLLREWLSRGYQGMMEWMDRNVEKRIDIRSVQPGAKSVVVVALNYYIDACHSDEPNHGKISRYAWGDDYHDVMIPRLEVLLEFIQCEVPGAKGKVYVDTGPVIEKAWAVRAGVGWEGKHTNVISRDFGSWIFLGELILDIGLEYDEPSADHCGTCTRCIDACPTQAITEPYVLNSNLCISYLTIEHKGEIPESISPQFENWIYGCDICQDVCPWNHKFSKPAQEAAFSPRVDLLKPSLTDFASMTEEQFQERFRGSPMKRAKHSGLMRNVKAILKKRELVPEKS
jgi:epoxyqueuosine reductase